MVAKEPRPTLRLGGSEFSIIEELRSRVGDHGDFEVWPQLRRLIGRIESADAALLFYLTKAESKVLSQQLEDIFDRPSLLQIRMRDMLVRLATKTESQPLRDAILAIDVTVERSWKANGVQK